MSWTSSPSALDALLRGLYDLELSEVSNSSSFQSLRENGVDKELLLAAIPIKSQPSSRPLHLLYTILTEISGPWPSLPLVRCYSRLSKALPEEAKIRREDATASLVNATGILVKQSYESFLDFLGRSDCPALRATDVNNYISHRGLYRYVSNFNLCLQTQTNGQKPVVAIALPNGPLLAATCIAVTTYYMAAPINPATGAEQFRADLKLARASCLLITRVDFEKLQLTDDWAAENGMSVLFVEWSTGDNIEIQTTAGVCLPPQKTLVKPNQGDDVSLVLFTSGTSGKKKVVPLTLHSIIAGVIFVMDSWGLSSKDICLNMMPLYHV